MRLILIGMMLVITGCAGVQIKKLDLDLDPKGTSNLGTIGLKDDRAIIQKETAADDELRIQQWRNQRAEEALMGEWNVLKDCRVQLSDSRLNGTLELPSMLKIDQMKQPGDLKEELGLGKNNELEFVTKEDFVKRIAIERKYAESIKNMSVEVKESNETCEMKLKAARIKAGLSGERYGSESLDHELARKNVSSIAKKE